MRTIFRGDDTQSRGVWGARPTVASMAAHGLMLLLIAGVMHRSARFVAPYKLPGKADGHNFLVAYLPDRAAGQTAVSKAQPTAAVTPKTPLPLPDKQPARASALPAINAPESPHPNAATGADALGSGNITIALGSYFPAPKPDLSRLPRGTSGDVILHVVIDTNGHISELKMTSGLGHGIDETVIATVEQWVFHPALANGVPVASAQELHFHYERG